ncbi:4-carboxy-4-hydroxy-2-oxoadipate aldolase/oxaloacetate decarboxylase [Aerococcaceae bacterium INB8]|uniref:Putative 4-hydroxy-4-methyl-2-oxoglutarate aldolase n=1 Tax=Ruoffia halotolerans TaxID=2748684 RepID=A0A839A3H7_9LACT|nr:4-carboxy-4-hydroxy-2-oxoadipate aldolase/oxaloacetate decarboxylase [Ruoffia halotolerans]MBA5728709.1 4-carboxy-4-hydroxy-2-oxoadipate aldolase/oxaloacetate decarboxylase [Ruoffia halotolerans]
MDIKKNHKVNLKLVEAFKKQSTATIHEVMGKKGDMLSVIKPVRTGMKLCGQALTVKGGPSDNLMIIKAVSMIEEGHVLVVNNGESDNTGPFGEVLAVNCMARGAAGVVINTPIRDSEAISELGLPVFSNGTSISGTTKAVLGTINHTISCGNVVVNPGDIILGDEDGVVVVPLEIAEEVLEKAIERDRYEKEVMNRIKNGESLFEIYGYQKNLDRLNALEEI